MIKIFYFGKKKKLVFYFFTLLCNIWEKMMDSSENENELNVNESVIEKDVENLKSANFRTKNNVVKRNEEKSIQTSFENLYVQRRT
jgi:hypothetical protein